MISEKTARNICFCYQQIAAGEELLLKCMEHLEKNKSLSFEDINTGRISHLQLGIPTSLSTRSILQVDDELAMKMIRKHIQNKKDELENFNEMALIEANT